MTHLQPFAPDLACDALDAFRRAVHAGLSANPPILPGKYLWDERGSRIFEAITSESSYYLSAAEAETLQQALTSVVAIIGAGATIVEFGSGACRKIRPVLDRLDRPRRYLALDIAGPFLEDAAAKLQADYPDLTVCPLCADYSRPLPPLPYAEGPRLGVFFGTTIGNMDLGEARAVLEHLRRALGRGWLLIFQDGCQDSERLREAYGSPLMAAFHENLLRRLSSDLGAHIAPSDALRHEARVRSDPTRVEAYLVAKSDVTITLDGRSHRFAAGSAIRTDLSCKYDSADFVALAESAGWEAKQRWSSDENGVNAHLLSCGGL